LQNHSQRLAGKQLILKVCPEPQHAGPGRDCSMLGGDCSIADAPRVANARRSADGKLVQWPT